MIQDEVNYRRSPVLGRRESYERVESVECGLGTRLGFRRWKFYVSLIPVKGGGNDEVEPGLVDVIRSLET